MDIRFRSIDVWSYPETPAYDRHSRHRFKAPWSATLELLDRELRLLTASDIVVECFLRPSDIRLDGWPRADAKVPTHPGAALHFDAGDLGHLRYATDAYETYETNLRAIGLGLEALRAVDRYGITRGSEQYRGFAELPAGIAVGAVGAGPRPMTLSEAATFIIETAIDGKLSDADLREARSELLADRTVALEFIRAAEKETHPDAGGVSEEFDRVQKAKAIVLGGFS